MFSLNLLRRFNMRTHLVHKFQPFLSEEFTNYMLLTTPHNRIIVVSMNVVEALRNSFKSQHRL